MPVKISTTKSGARGAPKLEAEPLKPELQTRSRERRRRLSRAAEFERLPIPLPNDLYPSLALGEIRLVDIKMPKRQVRKVGPDDITEVAHSISRFRVSAPIMIGRDSQLIDGAVVVAAARKLGLDRLPCVRIEHLDDEQQRAFRLLLNRMGHKREHDVDLLREELEELEQLKQPIRGLGYTDQELDQVLQPPVTSSDPLLDDEGTDHEPVCVTGDLWTLGEHVLLCGDAKESNDWRTLLGQEQARLVLTDPPYAVDVAKIVSTSHRDFVEGGGDMTQDEFEDMIEAVFTLAFAALPPGGMLFSYMDWKHVSDLIEIGKALGYELANLVTWVKGQGGQGSFYRSQSEFVVVLKKPGKHKNNVELGKHGRDRTNVWNYPGAGTLGSSARQWLKDHPTPKPVEMLADAILDVTDAGDVVVDPFGGSGSTLIACEETRRRARLIEKDPLYCDLIIRRWMQATGEMPVLVATGQTYAELCASRAGGGAVLETIGAA